MGKVAKILAKNPGKLGQKWPKLVLGLAHSLFIGQNLVKTYN